MAISLYGSINFDKLMDALKSGKVKTYKTENGVRLVGRISKRKMMMTCRFSNG